MDLIKLVASTITQPLIVKFKSHSFKEKIYQRWKNVNKNIKLVLPLRRGCSQLLNKLITGSINQVKERDPGCS